MRKRLRSAAFATLLACLPVAALAAGSQAVVPPEWANKLHGSPLDANNNQVDDELEALPPTQTVSVVLDLTACMGVIEKTRLAAFGTVDDEAVHFANAHMSGVLVSRLVALAQDPIVAFVEKDREVYHTLAISNPAIQVKPSAAYPAPMPPANPITVHEKFPGLLGSGGGIVVIDSGVDNAGGSGDTHESLPSTNGGLICPGSGINPQCVGGVADDVIGTGTAVAAIALGSGEGGVDAPHQGIAPEGSLFDVQVNTSPGVLNLWRLTRVLDAVVNENQYWRANIALLPWSTCVVSNGTDALTKAVDATAHAGLLPVVGMGNCTTCKGKTPFCTTCPCQNVFSPAGAADAITVGFSDDHGTISRADDNRDADSLVQTDLSKNTNLKPDLLAPGRDIETAVANTLHDYANISGSSAAAAHVAGCAALMLDAYSTDVSSLKTLLLGAAEDRGPAGWDSEWGAGLLNCFKAVDDLNEFGCWDLRFPDPPCGGPGQGKCWGSPSLRAENDPVDGVPNRVLVDVANDGPGFSPFSKLTVRVDLFSNGDNGAEICTIDLPPIAPGTIHHGSCPWTPKISGGAPGIVHACLFGDISTTKDCALGNNHAQHNENIAKASSPAVLAMAVENPSDQTVNIELQPTFDCAGGSCPGWAIGTSQNFFNMAPEDCATTVLLSATPQPPAAVREAKFQVQVLGHGGGGQLLDLGGVTMRARLACATAPNLRWISNTDFTWTGPTGYSVCPTGFDVVRGSLPITKYPSVSLRGDYSSGSCLYDEIPSGQAGDTTVPPVGGGFYYIARAGGYDPGSWDVTDIGLKGHVDDTLRACQYPAIP